MGNQFLILATRLDFLSAFNSKHLNSIIESGPGRSGGRPSPFKWVWLRVSFGQLH